MGSPLYFRYHRFYLDSHTQKVLVQHTLPFFFRRKGVELGQFHIPGFLLGYLRHVEIRLAEELGGLELFRFLYVHAVAAPSLGLDEITRRLSAYPACRHIGYFGSRNKAVHVLVQVDARLVSVYGDAFLELYHFAEYVVGGTTVRDSR